MKKHVMDRPAKTAKAYNGVAYSLPKKPASGRTTQVVHKAARKRLSLPLVILTDLLLVGAGLMVFAYFHHVQPRHNMTAGISLIRPSEGNNPAESRQAAAVTTGSALTTQLPETQPEQVTTASADETTSDTSLDTGSWHARFADQFTDGEIIQTADTYRSAHLAIIIERRQIGDATCFLADVYLSTVDQFRTAFAGGSYGRNLADDVLDMAVENRAVLAMNGDYYGIRDKGIVVRNGILYRDVLFDDVLVLYADGHMETTTAASFSMDRLYTEKAWQAWSFGPMLLDRGQPMTRFNSRVNPDNPRSAIGYFEPGHYCFVLVDGRQTGYSEGMTLAELSRLFYDLGCKAAYNLDGGASAILTFLGQVVNQPYKGGREISDIVYIADISADQ